MSDDENLENLSVEELKKRCHQAAVEYGNASLAQEVWLRQLSSVRECPWVQDADKLYQTLEFLWVDSRDNVAPKLFEKIQTLVSALKTALEK